MAECRARITVDAGNVRARPQAGTSIVGIARRDDELLTHSISEVDAQNFRWLEVTVSQNNLRGWIREDLVQLVGDCASLGIASISPVGEPMGDPEPEDEPAPPPPPLPVDDDITILTGDCQGEVRVFLARVRSEPEPTSNTLGMLQRRTKFTLTHISDEDNDGFKWYGFEFEGQTGWTREDLLTITGHCLDPATHGDPEPVVDPPLVEDPDPDPEPLPVIAETCLANIQLARANVRAQATTSSAIVGAALRDESYPVKAVTAIQSDGFPWIEIDFNGRKGFIRFDLAMLTGDCANFVNDDRLAPPVAANITQGFHTQHEAVDFPVPIGTTLRVAIPATVVLSHACPNCQGDPTHIFTTNPTERNRIFNDANWGWGYGEHVIVRHNMADVPASTRQQLMLENARETDFVFVLYAHMSRRDVSVNQQLPADTTLGLTGHTGFSTAAHLHLEVAFGRQWSGAKKVHPAVLFNIQRKMGF